MNYVAPGLFHLSPLWRPVAWDPLHTSPEEVLGYIGLVPLFLALGAVVRGWRADPAIRALTVVAAVTLVLSLGPYVPGFRALIMLPGFSFFRAPARWGLATSLALSLLAGRGFDALATWPKPGRAARRFVIASVAAILVVVGGFELALASSRGNGVSLVALGFDRILKALPWADQAESKSFRAVMVEAYRPQFSLRTQFALARLDGKPAPWPGPTLAAERLAIYPRELGETGALLAALLVISTLARRPRAFAVSLLVFTLVDGLIQARHRPFDLGPVRPSIEQSPVLTRLAREPRGTRTLDSAHNLFMIAGATPVLAYRTLDLPAPGGLLQIAQGSIADFRVTEVLRAAGVGVWVFDPLEMQELSKKGRPAWASTGETINDPALASWLLGSDLSSASGLQDVRPISTGGRAEPGVAHARQGPERNRRPGQPDGPPGEVPRRDPVALEIRDPRA